MNIVPFKTENNIPIVLSTNDNYAKYLSVIIRSIIENSNSNYNYDIIILESNIKNFNKKLILSQISKNVSIRFIDITKKITGKKFFISHHVTIATYYRLFIANILKKYDKVIYLDVDMIVLDDIAKLFSIDIGNNLLGAAYNVSTYIHFATGKNFHGICFRDYCKNVLKLNNLYNYFQAGVLIMNLKALREIDFEKKAIDLINTKQDFILYDQDILNSICQYRVKYISQSWNLFYTSSIDYIKGETRLDYLQALKKPSIVHFAGELKPWKCNSNFIEYYGYWWKNAAKSPFALILYFNYLIEFILRFIKNVMKTLFIIRIKTF